MTDRVPFSPTLARVDAGALCTGCGGCAALAPEAIEMRLEAPGFLRPHQHSPLSKDQDAAIAVLCPGLAQTVEAEGREDHPLWGPYVSMRTGWATDSDLRFRGSSGGVLSGLLAWMIDSGMVAGALTNTADPARAVANVATVAQTRAEVAETAGSRYAPSAPLAALGARADDTGPRAFVGKPCDAAAFRALEAQTPDLSARFPVVLSFFCAGVPSLAGGEAVLKALDVTPEDTAAFRYRGHGWPGQATATTKSGKTSSMSYHDSWGHILSKEVQHRCKLCADGTGTAADIVCADAWETDARGYPLFEEADGISLVVARTQKGADILARAEAAGAIVTEPFDVARLEAMQPGQARRRQALLARLWAQRVLGLPAPRYRGLGVARAARMGSLPNLLRNFAGTLRRGLKARRTGR